MHKIMSLIILLLAAPSMCFAQAKVPLEVVHSGKDRVGQLFVTELKEIMRAHSARPVTDRQRPRIVVLVTTADGDSQLRGSSSAISVSILYDAPRMPGEGAFLRSMAQSCSRENAPICARNAAADVEYEVSLLRRNWPALWASL